MKRKYIFLISAIILAVVFASVTMAEEFWTSKKSNKYHYPSCQWAQKIAAHNLIKFNSPEEAQSAGYVPCKVCKPPASSKQSNTESIKDRFLAKRGCCSHHGGVCGCDEATGRIKCCDGTLSPTCTCADYCR